LDETGKWSPREDFNLHYRVRSPVVCALAYEGLPSLAESNRDLELRTLV
jgi:hypothetical protein